MSRPRCLSLRHSSANGKHHTPGACHPFAPRRRFCTELQLQGGMTIFVALGGSTSADRPSQRAAATEVDYSCACLAARGKFVTRQPLRGISRTGMYMVT
jgi:hypothetical protein